MLKNEEVLKTLNQKIEDARNVQTLTEHDVVRLKKLKLAQEAEIRELVNTKAELNNDILNLKSNKQNLLIDVSNLEKSTLGLNQKIKEEEIKLASIQNNESFILKERETNEALYSQKNKALVQREESVSNREENIKDVERRVADKHAKIMSLVAELQK